MAFSYNIEDHSLFKTAFRLRHTVWPYVLCSVGFWLFFILHLVLWVVYHCKLLELYGPRYGLNFRLNEGLLHIQWEDAKIISAITTFFEVFYTQQCYSRYLELNCAVNQIFRSSHRFCYEFKQITCGLSQLSGLQPMRLVTRWMHAQLVLFFVEVREGPLGDGHWKEIMEFGLLKEDEVRFLSNYTGPQRGLLLLDWIGRVAVYGFEESQFKGKGNIKGLLDRLLDFDEAQKHVMDLIWMPVPFQYFHMLNIMIFVNIGLWSYVFAMGDSAFGPILYFFALFIFVGMLELAKLFSDPFGEDEVDFPIHVWLGTFIQNQLAFLEYDFEAGRDCFKQRMALEEKLEWAPDKIVELVGERNRRRRWSETVSALRTSTALRPKSNEDGGAYRLIPTEDTVR